LTPGEARKNDELACYARSARTRPASTPSAATAIAALHHDNTLLRQEADQAGRVISSTRTEPAYDRRRPAHESVTHQQKEHPMFVCRLIEPIDLFDVLTPLNGRLTRQDPSRTAWALQAGLALTEPPALHTTMRYLLADRRPHSNRRPHPIMAMTGVGTLKVSPQRRLSMVGAAVLLDQW
jgi:hypothetical protein